MSSRCTFFLAAAMAVVAAVATAAETPLFDGEDPVYSPDGARIAFRRYEDGVFKLGVFDRATGAIDWIENGPGNASYPAWTPDGALVYMYGHDGETAREAWLGGSQSGYGLRLCEPNGEKRDLTHGRCRDYAPCVSPDGAEVWFVTTRGVESESASFSKAAATRLALLDLLAARSSSDGAPLPEPRVVLDSPHGNNSGYVQPAISPDGRFIVWGQLENFFEGWRVFGTRMDALRAAAAAPASASAASVAAIAAPATPSSLTALAPRWHPDCRTICFTGFRNGDSGWGVWVEDIESGSVRRLCSGENPCFSPDGAAVVYDRDGTVYERPFDPSEAGGEFLPDLNPESVPETVLWSQAGIDRETTVDLAGDTGKAFAFGDDGVFFVRGKVHLAPGGGVREYVRGAYAEHPRAFQIYSDAGGFHFVSRDPSGKYFAAHVAVPGGATGRTHEFVAVRTPTRILLSVDGAPPQFAFPGAALPLDTPLSIAAGSGFVAGDHLESLEIGTGWPREIPRAKTREDLFR